MPVARRSCDSCFKGRRKCDLVSPTCGRCQRRRRGCHYTRRSETPQNPSSPGTTGSDVDTPWRRPCGNRWSADTSLRADSSDGKFMVDLLNLGIPNMIGLLGDMPPVTGNTQSWQWVIRQIKSYPKAFAQRAETEFIHKNSLVSGTLSRPMRAAFGICTAYSCMNADNRAVVFRSLDAEMAELWKPTENSTLLDDLAVMQAVALYQTIRLFDGDLQHRLIAEQQHFVLGVRALALLHRAEAELRNALPTWETWILAEAVRRTVMMSFMVYGVHAVFKQSVCPVMPTLAILPLSTQQGFWSSRAAYVQHAHEDVTLRYEEFTAHWLASPPRKLQPFEKVILVACKGLESVNALSLSDDLDQGISL
ncbi:hypothetical protein GQ53DRAFT_92838 [Thozetella sp. PMI_491]|nr:hypothetical protein GQ53DRAFT_92838 [Thozetella sp. PMI_491]